MSIYKTIKGTPYKVSAYTGYTHEHEKTPTVAMHFRDPDIMVLTNPEHLRWDL